MKVSKYKKENIAQLEFDRLTNKDKKQLQDWGVPSLDKNVYIANYWQLGELFDYFTDIEYTEGFAKDYSLYLTFLEKKKESLERRIVKMNKAVETALGPGKKLFEHQEYAIRFSALRDSFILADDMGAGKTASFIGSLPAKAPVLVISPSNAKHTWRKQFKLWLDKDTEILDGRKSFKFPKAGEVVILNYDILPEDLFKRVPRNEDGTEKSKQEKDKFNRELKKQRDKLLAACPEGMVVILDEAHRLKNRKSLRGRRFSYISDKCKERHGKIWAATGTPLNNNADELYAVLCAIDAVEESFGTGDNFRKEFGGQLTNYGMKYGAPRPTAKNYLANVMLRRTVDDIFDLPPYNEITDWYIEIDEATRKACDDFEDILVKLGISLEEALEQAFNPNSGVAQHVLQIKEKIAIAKIPAIIEKVDELEALGHIPIVASCHIKPLEFFGAREGWAMIRGGVSAKNRSDIEDNFQARKYKGLALSVLAGGEALTLTEASYMIVADKYWGPGANAQVKGRIRRPGQKRPMFVYLPEIVSHPLEAKINEILARKESIIQATVDEVTRIDRSNRKGMVL